MPETATLPGRPSPQPPASGDEPRKPGGWPEPEPWPQAQAWPEPTPWPQPKSRPEPEPRKS